VLIVEDLRQQRLPARSLASVLRQAGLAAHLLQFGGAADLPAVVALAGRLQPRLIVLSILFAHLVADNLALAEGLHAAGVTAHITLVGALPSLAAAELLQACPALSSVLCGEAEASLANLAACLVQGTDWRAVPGLAHRAPGATVNPMPLPIANLDTLPWPARDGGIPTTLGYGFATLEASRGCYHSCAFCLPCAFYRTLHQNAGRASTAYRLRSLPHVMDELEALYRQGAQLFMFDDEQFLPPGDARRLRVRQLGDQLRRRGLDIAFTIKCRADDVEQTLFRELRAMGLIRVYLGVESGCPATLEILAKGVTAADNLRALAGLDQLDILADFRSLLFHPWSTLATIQADIEFLELILPHVPTPFTFHEVECYPGTGLGERLRADLADARGDATSAAEVWPMPYTVADPAAELLRRLNRVVFGARRADQGSYAQLVQAWYHVGLLCRFRPDHDYDSQAMALRRVVQRWNAGTLALWRDMMAFVGNGPLYHAERVNRQAALWASRVNTGDMWVAEEVKRVL
jgi:hypothetical protein